MNLMKKTLLHILLLFCFVSAFSQVYKQGQLFRNVNLINGQVAFVKEITIPENMKTDAYFTLRSWGKSNYAKDPFTSSIAYSEKSKEIIATSKIDFVLPDTENQKGEKVTMSYKLNAYIDPNNCVVEISDIKFSLSNAKKYEVAKTLSAENFVSNDALRINDALQSIRQDTKKYMLNYFNDLCINLERTFGHK